MNEAAHFLFIVGTLSTFLIAVLIVRAMVPKFFCWFRKTAFPVPKVLASTVSLVFLAVFVISKEFPPGSFYSLLQSPYSALYSPSSATLNAATNALSPAQYRAGFALTTVTNVMHDFTAPTNAVFCDLGSGVHDEAYWIPVSFNPEGTATNSRWGRAVCATPSGMVLLDDVPDRLAPPLPDLSGAVTNRILSILQTPSGLLPPNAGLWHAPTTNGSFLVTWNKIFLGRQTNAVADLQLELFQSGDFIYRLHLDENADASSVTNWLIAAQDNGGGEVFAFAENIPLPQLESDPFSLVAATNLIPSGISLFPQTLELRWTSFGELDPGLSDNDGDGLSDWDELYVHHTDPGNADTDADGLWDGEEVNQYGTIPVNADSNGDGDLDFWQVFSPTSFTNAPWAQSSGDDLLISIATRLEDASQTTDLAVLRIGDAMIPVLPDNWLMARVSVPAGGSTPFILIPGPHLSETATAKLVVVGVSSAATVFPFIDDPLGVLDTSPIYGTVSAQPQPPHSQKGCILGLNYEVTPELLCPHTGRDTVAIQALGKMFPKPSFLLDFNGSRSISHKIEDSDIENPLSTQPGLHEGAISVFPILLNNGNFLGSGIINIPAHYCVPFSSVNYPECDPGSTNYNPYAVPAPTDSPGVISRPPVTLIVESNDDSLFVDLDGSDSYANRCPICGCTYGPDSGHTPAENAVVYRWTDGLGDEPSTLTSNGCFTVSGAEPSDDYGDDVFTYEIDDWYNRGRYTVLGLKNYLLYAGGPVDKAHVAVGVTNALFFWTGVKLPTGNLNVTLSGEGKAKLVVYNRATHLWEDLLTPTDPTYTSTIAAWRNTYCDPNTLRVQASLVPMTNGLCTLTQHFEGSGNGIDISHSASQVFRIHTFVAEPITSETDGEGYVYNPSGIPVGGTSKFKVSLDPMTGFSENDITWAGAGVSFAGGDNKGSEVTVVGGSAGSYMLLVGVNGLPLVPGPTFFGKVLTPTTAPVTVWIVRDNYGSDAPITVSQIQPIIDDANKILRQKALTLQWSGTANYTNCTEWQDITDALNPTNAALDALLDCSKNTGGVEIYFVKTLTAAGNRTLNGVNCYNGLVLAKTDSDGSGLTGHVLAHETSHQCGLYDIYKSMADLTSLVVSGPPSYDRLPYDWCDGYYPKQLTQAELIQRLLMHGIVSGPGSESSIDIPSGPVYGLCYTNAPVTGNEIWYLDMGKVGQSDISDQTPNHH